nr:hypothetical protein [Tanacetum cinerariifolium]
MDNKKHIVNLEYFKEMLHICPRLSGQTFDELPFKEEILAFLRFLGHSGEIRRLTDNKQQFGAMLPIELTNADIRNSKAYKEYYAVATGATPPKTKASVWKTKSSFDTTVTPPPTAAVGSRLFTSAKGKQPVKASKAKSLTTLSEVAMTEAEQFKLATKKSLQQTHISQASGSGINKRTDSNEEGKEFIHPRLTIHDEEETRDEERFDPILKTPENTDDEGNGEENLGLNVGREERQDKEDDENELYRDVNINLEGRGVQVANVHTTQEFKDSYVTLTLVNHDGQQQSSYVSSQFVTSMLNPTPDAGIDSIFETTSQMDVQAPTTMAPLPLSAPTLTPSTIATITTTLEDNFSKFVQTNQFAGVVSSIPVIVQRYMDQRMNEAVKVAVQIQSDRLCDEAQADNEEFLKNLDKNIQKIVKEQVKEQILIEKIEGNKSIHRSNEQRDLYKALVKAYESDKIILDTYGDTVMLKKRRNDATDKDEEPYARSNWGSKRRREGKKPKSTSAPKEKATRTFLMNRLKVDTLTPKLLAGPTYELMKGSCKSLVELEFFLKEVYNATTDQLDWINPEGQQYLHNLLKPLPLIPNSRDRHVIPFDHFINNDFEYLRGDLVPQTMWIQEPVGYNKHALWGISHWGCKRQQFYRFAVDRESARDKTLNLTRPDTYHSNLKRKEAYIVYSNPKGFIYQNKDKQNRLIWIDELHKFSNGTLTDVRTALDDRLKGFRMKYMPQTI